MKVPGLALGMLLILCLTGLGEGGVGIGWSAGARPAAKAMVELAGATSASGVIVATGGILATGDLNPGRLYRIDPTQPAGAVTTVATNLRGGPLGIAFDGSQIWTANIGASVSLVTPGSSLPWTVTTVRTGFLNLHGILYDGASVWVTDNTAGTLLKLDAAGAVLQTVTVGAKPDNPIFDGSNIWVPSNGSSSVSVVRASSGAILAALTGNGLTSPYTAAFDGQRVLVTNYLGDSVSLWKAADLSPIGSVSTGAFSFPTGVCSDGINFWITLNMATGQLARF